MMSPLLTLMVSPLLLQVQAGASCSQRDYFETPIKVIVDKKPIDYIRDVTLAELNNRLKSSLLKRQTEMGTNVYLTDDENVDSLDLAISGTTSADISFHSDVNFLALPQNARNSRYCIIYKDVTVNITYQTKMTIAKELEEGACAYDAVLDHQMKHHHANEKVVDTLVETLKADLPSILGKLEHNYVERRDVRKVYDEMIAGLEGALKPYQENMDALIKEYADFIDTPEELRELANSCNN